MVTSFDSVEPADTEGIALAILPKEAAEDLTSNGEADFACSFPSLGRFRINVFRQLGVYGLVVRRVLPGFPSFETLGLPTVVSRLADESRGLVLVTGSAGSGRTTTMAAMIDHINSTRSVNIVTIESPVEVLHSDKMAIVNQREVGVDTRDYPTALRRIVRQDPDVVMIDEIRDAETLWAALAAAESGHYVLSSLSTANAIQTITRLVDFFPQSMERQVRNLLGVTLKGVISQRLLERADGRGRIPGVEVLVMTSRVNECLVECGGRNDQLEEVMDDGEYYGMQTFDQSLYQLFKNGLVSLRDAVAAASRPVEFRIALQSAGLISVA
jgi:twitching motility protein PilT